MNFLLAIIYLSFISLGLPDALLGGEQLSASREGHGCCNDGFVRQHVLHRYHDRAWYQGLSRESYFDPLITMVSVDTPRTHGAYA